MESQKFVNDKVVSKITGRAIQTLRNDRFMGKGIPYVKLGRQVVYDVSDIYEFMDRRKIRPEE